MDKQNFETGTSFAARLARWAGDSIPVEVRETPAIPATAPGALIMSACGGRAMLFATGYPDADDDGRETYHSAELWVDAALGLAWLAEFDRAARSAGVRLSRTAMDTVIDW